MGQTPVVREATTPPAYAWDWFGRQHLLWREARRRLVPTATPPSPAPAADVPDWDGRRLDVHRAAAAGTTDTGGPRDYSVLDTRAGLVAALRADYPLDARVREVVDTVIVEFAFLGHQGGELSLLGMRTPPRGLRWWWSHLGGTERGGGTATVDANDTVPVQLRLVDVQAGYGDHAGTFEWSTR
jgi:hypothetical protein